MIFARALFVSLLLSPVAHAKLAVLCQSPEGVRTTHFAEFKQLSPGGEAEFKTDLFSLSEKIENGVLTWDLQVLGTTKCWVYDAAVAGEAEPNELERKRLELAGGRWNFSDFQKFNPAARFQITDIFLNLSREDAEYREYLHKLLSSQRYQKTGTVDLSVQKYISGDLLLTITENYSYKTSSVSWDLFNFKVNQPTYTYSTSIVTTGWIHREASSGRYLSLGVKESRLGNVRIKKNLPPGQQGIGGPGDNLPPLFSDPANPSIWRHSYSIEDAIKAASLPGHGNANTSGGRK